MYVDTLVLGAGISGLAYASEKRKQNENVVIFEAEPFPGGLCHSFKIASPLGAFTFDSAVHLSFTENSEARSFFDETNVIKHVPVIYNYYQGQWIKHPLINNLYPFDISDKVRLIKSFMERRNFNSIQNYGEWLRASYGEEIAHRFYYVYTKKYWTVEPEDMTTSWISVRLNTPDIEKMLFGAFSPDTGNDYYAKEMRYPRGNGGYETFLGPMRDAAVIECNKRACGINPEQKVVRFTDGTSCSYRKLVSSVPLPELVRIIENIPASLQEKAVALKASKVSLVSIGFNKPGIAKWLWFYIYDDDIFTARVNSPSIKSKENAPEGCSSLQFEVYHHPGETIDKNEMIENTLYAIRKMRLCLDEDILFMDYRLLPYGNVIFLHNMEKNRDSIKEWLTNAGIDLIGRFGEWDYLWSDQSYLSGKRKAGRERLDTTSCL